MKRKLLISLILCLGLVSGCGSREEGSENVEFVEIEEDTQAENNSKYSLEELFPSDTVSVYLGDYNRITGEVDSVLKCNLLSATTSIGIGKGYNKNAKSEEDFIEVDKNGSNAGDLSAEEAVWSVLDSYRVVGENLMFMTSFSYNGSIGDISNWTNGYTEVKSSNEDIESVYWCISNNKLNIRMKPKGKDSIVDVIIYTMQREEISIEELFKDNIEDVVFYIVNSFDLV